MDRRSFVRDALVGLVTLSDLGLGIPKSIGEAAGGESTPRTPAGQGSVVKRLFPVEVKELEWAEFPAAGFAKPVCGVIYGRDQRPELGMPIGGIDTGCLNLDADATFGFCSVFNSIVPQRGPLKLPFLGMSVGKQVWVLSDPAPKDASGSYMWAGVETPTEIRYWGHYPVADLEYDLEACPLSVGLRAWAPFLPGDSATSNTPGAVFEVRLRNVSGSAQQGRLAFSFPGPTQAEAQISTDSPREKLTPSGAWVAVAPESVRALREEVRGKFSGLVVKSEKVKEIGYALGVVGDEEVHVGGGLAVSDSPVSAWSKIGSELPKAEEKDFSGSISVGYELQPGEEKTIRFVLAWYAPMWIGEGSHTFTHMYTTRYKSALEVAQFLSGEHDALLQRILGWQQVIYSEQKYPVWLRESLVNILYLFAMHSLWAAARPPVGPWCRPGDGLFGMIQGLVEYAGVEILSDSWYANAPLPLFFPDLMLSTLRGYKAYQFANGAAVWSWGGSGSTAEGGYESSAGTEMATPSPGYQTTTNGASYIDLLDRYWQRTGNDEVLREFYSSIKRNTIYTIGLRTGDGPDGIISVPNGNLDPYRPQQKEGLQLDWWDAFYSFGMSTQVGGLHLAQLRMAERIAEKVGDNDFAQQCRQWYEQGSESMETKLWTGEYYLRYSEPKTGRKSDDVFAYELDGQWIAKFHGLPGVFPSDRAKTTLNTIKKTCIAATPYGALNLTRPNGELVHDQGYGPYGFFVSEVPELAMTYMYEGDQEFGLELARRYVHDVTINLKLEWNQPNIIRGDNGQREFGQQITQNMILWALPAALQGQDIAAFCAPRGFVGRILNAAKKS